MLRLRDGLAYSRLLTTTLRSGLPEAAGSRDRIPEEQPHQQPAKVKDALRVKPLYAKTPRQGQVTDVLATESQRTNRAACSVAILCRWVLG